MNFKKHSNTVILGKIRKNDIRFAYVPFDFISSCLFVFTMKLKHANYKSHWNILVFYERWKMMSDLDIPHGKMSNFTSFPLFGFILDIKLRIFDFESHWNVLTFCYK